MPQRVARAIPLAPDFRPFTQHMLFFLHEALSGKNTAHQIVRGRNP
jgi:hypothetical protein